MHPDIARTLATQRRDELVRQAASGRRTGRRWFPRWHVTWTRTVLAPAGAAGGSRAGRRGSSLVIIISAHRSA